MAPNHAWTPGAGSGMGTGSVGGERKASAFLPQGAASDSLFSLDLSSLLLPSFFPSYLLLLPILSFYSLCALTTALNPC